MTAAVLDINDCNLQLWHGQSLVQSPGYALLDGQNYRFGAPARAAARLQPRNINTRFWWQLSTEALQPALGPARHSADLVHAHLQSLHEEAGQPPEVLLAVSGSMQREQLALLLGIVQACPFDPVGLVNRSVALGSLCGGTGRIVHLELQLHQALVSDMDASGGEVRVKRTVPLPGCGLLQMQERLVEIIAAAFIRQTRFDPRRKAATEQDLYDRLPDALRALGRGSETNIEVNGYRARINRADLVPAGQRLFDSGTEAVGELARGDRILMDPIAQLLPGLEAHFPGARVLEPDAVCTALREHGEVVLQRDQALHFVTALPGLGLLDAAPAPLPVTPPESRPEPQTAEREEDVAPEPEAARPSAARPNAARPTHLLQGSQARPLLASGTTLAEGWEIFAVGNAWQLRGGGSVVQVNGVDYRPAQELASGDRIIANGGPEALLIEVVP